jgi:hypothetical protein
MARGWESKSVEDQQAEAIAEKKHDSARLSPAEIKRAQDLRGLELSKQHVQQQLLAAQNPRRREMLQRALADLEHKLSLLSQ